jgi:hypothetical protein
MFQIFKKRKDLLVIILTSSDTERARRTYDSIINSKKNISIDIEIIVNSLNKEYIKKVKNEFKKEKLIITETESNGGCGKGKNSALNHFRNHKKNYDYLMQIDGDDFLYPTAFENFEKMLSKSPDIIGLQASDTLIKNTDKRATVFFENSEKKENRFLHSINDSYYLHSWNELELNLNKKFPKNVFENVSEQQPPDRNIFLSSNIIKNEKNLMLPEDIQKFTDYVFSTRLYEKALNKGYSYAHFSNSQCYIYDRTNENAVSSTYEKFNQSRTFFDEKFPQLIEDSVRRCGYKIDFKIIPHFQIGFLDTMKTNDKIDFIKKNII